MFWLARKHIGDDRAACNLALAYLLFPAVQWIALFDFHPVTLAVPLLLYMIWFLDEDRLLAATVFAVLAASSKEDIPLAIAGIGLWYAVRRHRPLVGWAMVVLGVAWTAVSLWIIVPHFGTGGPNPFYGRWESVGGSPSGIVKTLFTDPGQIWHEATTGKDLLYLFLLFVPFLFLWAFEPLLVVAALPILALNLLSTFPSMNSIRYQYVSAIVACVFAATAIGAGRLGPSARASRDLGSHGVDRRAVVVRPARVRGELEVHLGPQDSQREAGGRTGGSQVDPAVSRGVSLQQHRRASLRAAAYLPIPGSRRRGLGRCGQDRPLARLNR